MKGEDSEDRIAILARRAALVAGALASVGLAKRAEAMPQEGPAIAKDCRPRTPSEAELDEARRLVDEARSSADASTRISILARAYALAPRAGLAALLSQAHEQADDLDSAFAILVEELACGGPNPELERMRAELDARTARIRVFGQGARVTRIFIDGRERSAARATEGLRVRPGAHSLRLVTDRGAESTREVEVSAGTMLDVPIDAPPPIPCLSMLPPEEEPQREDPYALEIGFLPAVNVTGGDPWIVQGGGGLRIAIAARVARDVWFAGDLFWILTVGDDVTSGTAGTVAQLTWYPNGVIGFGAGFAGALGESSVPGAKDSDDAPQEGLFGPVAVPLSVIAGEYAKVELRVPFFFGATYWGTPAHDLRFQQILPHLSASFVFSEHILGRAF